MEIILVIAVVAFLLYFWLKRKKAGLQPLPTDYLPEAFVVLDLETTGLDSERHEIIELAEIRFNKGSATHKSIQALVKPSRKIPKKITDITGITQEMIDAEGEPLAQVIDQFAEFAGSLRLVTFNAEFDMAFLKAAYRRHGKTVPSNPVSCALKMSRRAWPSRKSFRLEDLTRDANIGVGSARRALEDARRALIIYAAAVAKLKSVS